MPRKLWKGKATKLAASPPYDTSQPHPAWSPLGNGVWENSKGRRLQLFPKPLIHLSDIERRHLKIIAHQKLQQLNLGQVNIPRDLSELKKKKGGLLKGGRSRATHFFDSLRDGKDTKDSSPLIFGIPLEKCMQNDQELRQLEAHRSRERRESLDLAQPVGLQTRRRSSRSLHSPQLSRKSSASSTALLEALSLSSSVNESHRRARRQSLAPNTDVRIPRVVSACFRFIEANGLRTEGIFRVSGSKKRVRQIREAYDRGDFVIFTRDQSPHDVGALLKEYFRDLPEPLLTRDLYNVFTSSTKFETLEEKVGVVRLGVCLLPIVHRDVLYSLMRFLSKVAAEAEKDIDNQGNEVAGSKMNAQNLGTLFGPNILKKTKGGLAPEKEKDLHADAAAHVERTRDVILTSCLLIQHYEEIFQIPVSLQEEVLRMLSETDPDALDFIMNQRNVEISFPEEPLQEEPVTADFGTNPVDTTSSSSGTFPCVIDDSSLASLSTIEDLVNENNMSEFEGNLVSQGSSDSLDVLEEEEDLRINIDYKDKHEQNGPVNDQTQGQERFNYARQTNVCNGPSDSATAISAVQDTSTGRGRDAPLANEPSHNLSPPHPPLKRGSIGLYAETMIALGIEVDPSGRDSSLKDEGGGGDVNRNHKNQPKMTSCQTCVREKESKTNSKQPPKLLSSPHRQGPRYNTSEDRTSGVMSTPSTVSSSSLSGSTSSSNASLATSDSGTESKKRLPNYDEVLKIKELGVKSYVTVNSSKYFVPVPPMAVEEGLSSPSEEVKGHTSPERVHLNHNERKLTDEKSLPPHSRVCRREHVSKTRHHHPLPTAYRRSPVNPNDKPSKPFTEDFRGKTAPRAILTDYPPKISLYQSWDFLDLSNDDEGEFDGPETYV